MRKVRHARVTQAQPSSTVRAIAASVVWAESKTGPNAHDPYWGATSHIGIPHPQPDRFALLRFL